MRGERNHRLSARARLYRWAVLGLLTLATAAITSIADATPTVAASQPLFRHLPPSYQQGLAHSPGESADPGLWRGLVGVWAPMLGPTGGSLRDQGRLSLTAALTSMDVPTDWAPGETGWHLDLDGSDDELTLPANLDSFFADEGTLVAWVRTTGTSQGLHNFGARLESGWYPFADGNWYAIAFRDDQLNAGNNSGFDKSEWHLVAATQRPGANGYNLYQNLNRFYTGAGETTVTLNDSANHLFGVNQNAAHFTGQVAFFALWNRALNPGELYRMYTDPWGMLRRRDGPKAPVAQAEAEAGGEGLRLWWPFWW